MSRNLPSRSNKTLPRRAWLAIAILLGATHAAAFLLARGPLAGAGVRETAVEAPPAKLRERMGNGGPAGSHEEIAARFTALLHELERSGLPEDKFEELREQLFREWIRRDLRSALDLMASPLTAHRYAELIDELEEDLLEEIARQPRESWDWIMARRYGSLTPKVAEFWLEAAMHDGQVDLALELLPVVPGFAQGDFVRKISSRARAGELAKLRDFLRNPEACTMEGREFSIRYYAEQLVKIAGGDDAGGVAALLAAEGDPEFRREIAMEWTQRELNHLPAADAVRRALELPAEVRGPVLVELADHERADPAAGLGLLDQMDAQGALAGLAQEDLESLTSAVVGGAVDDDSIPLADSFALLAGLGNPELRRAALVEMGGTYEVYSRTPELLENLAQIPAGADRDVLFTTLFHEIPDRRYLPGLIAAISDRELAARLQWEYEEGERGREE